MTTTNGVGGGDFRLPGAPSPKRKKKPDLNVQIPRTGFIPEPEHPYDLAGPSSPKTAPLSSLRDRINRKNTPDQSPRSSDNGSDTTNYHSLPASPRRGVSRQPDLANIIIDAMQSSPEMKINMAAQGNYYEYIDTDVYWGHRQYKLTLHIPLEDGVKYNEADLRAAIKKYTQAFLKDLQIKNANAGGKIKPGTNFGILIEGERYAAYVPKDPTDQPSIDDLIANNEQHVLGNDQNAIELSRIIQKRIPADIIREINDNPVIKSYSTPSTTPPKPTTQPGTQPLRIVKLKNLGNTCFLNTAFQKLATNEIFRKEILAHPAALINAEKDCSHERAVELGKKHPLYIALQQYEQAQGPNTPPPPPLDLSALFTRLGYRDPNIQSDSQEARLEILRQIDFAKLPQNSPLCSTSQSKWSYIHKDTGAEIWEDGGKEPFTMALRSINARQNAPLATLLLAQRIGPHDGSAVQGRPDIYFHQKEDVFQGPPGIFTVHVKQSDWNPDNFPIDRSGVAFIDKLISKKLGDDDLNKLFSKPDKEFTKSDLCGPYKRGTLSAAQKKELVEHILSYQDKTRFSLAVGFLDEADRQTYCAYVQPKSEISIDNPIFLDLPGELYGKPGETTPYELMSFSRHEGGNSNSGHYVTYIRDGENYWMQSDANEPQKLSVDAFKEAAKTAYELTYNKVGLKPAMIEGPKVPSADKAAVASTDESAKMTLLSEQYGEATVSAKIGDITQRSGAIIVGFTDDTLRKRNGIYEKAQVAAEIDKLRNKKIDKKKNPKGLYFSGEIVSTPAGSLEKHGVKKIYHAVLEPSKDTEKTWDALVSLVTESLKKADIDKAKHVAFSLPDSSIIEPSISYALILDTIQNYAKPRAKDIKQFEKIEIVVTQEQYNAILKQQSQPVTAKPATAQNGTAATLAKPVENAPTQDQESVKELTMGCIYLMRGANPVERVFNLDSTQSRFSPALRIPITDDKKMNLFLDELEAFSDEKNRRQDVPTDFSNKKDHMIYLNLPSDVTLSEATHARIKKVLNEFKEGSKVLTAEDFPHLQKPIRVGFNRRNTRGPQSTSTNGDSLSSQRMGGFDSNPFASRAPAAQSKGMLKSFWNGTLGHVFGKYE